MQTSTTRKIEIQDVALECLWLAQSGATRTIVFLHEGLGSVAMWRDFPARLCAACGTNGLVYSRAGYGQSSSLQFPRRREFMHDEARDVLPGVCAAFDIEHPILLGHSDGASIVLLYSAFFPQRPIASVVLAPHIMVEDMSLAAILRARKAFEETGLRERLTRYHADVDGAFYGWNDIWLDPAFRGWSIVDFLQNIRTPLLVIQGEEDEYGSMLQIDGIGRHVPHATLLKLSHCGHSPHRDQSPSVIRAVREFLERTG